MSSDANILHCGEKEREVVVEYYITLEGGNHSISLLAERVYNSVAGVRVT